MTESDTPWEPPLSGTLARRVTSTSQETVCVRLRRGCCNC